MKDEGKTKIQLIDELTKIRKSVAKLEKSEAERKQAERAAQEAREYAESIVETVRGPLVALDAGLRIISANRSFYQTFKVAAEETEGQPIYDLGNRQWDIPKLRELLEIILPENTVFDDFEMEHDFETVGQKIMLLNARRIYREANETQIILLAIEDITERKQAELSLRDARAELVRKERLAVLGQLAGSVGHELRNPLGVISNAVYYLKTVLPDADETTREYLDMISSEVHNSDKIVSDLLNLSRTKPADREEVSVSMLVRAALDNHPPPPEVKVSTELTNDLPPVNVDSQQIKQVLINLLSNACQAMPEGGSIDIKAEHEKDSVRLFIADTGCGMPEEVAKQVFEPLFTTKARGIGLGLSVSKNLVEVNGGSIEVESKEGEGSTFTIILPAKEAQS